MTEPEHIRAYEERDLDALLALRTRCFEGLDSTRERTRREWAFDHNPARITGAPSAWVAELDGGIVGTYGMLPARVYIDGVATPAVCGVDFCVDSELRGRGLGRRLTTAMVDTPGSKFRFITSPTEATTALMKERGAGVVDGVAEGALFACPGPFELGSAIPGLDVRTLTTFGAECDALAIRLARHHRFVTVRDAAYLQWRYLEDPFIDHHPIGAFADDGSLRGLAVLAQSPAESQGYIAELVVEPDDTGAARALLYGLASAATERGLEAMFAFERRQSMQPILRDCGFAAMPDGAPKPVLLLLGSSAEPADWFLSPGDGDFLFRIGNNG